MIEYRGKKYQVAKTDCEYPCEQCDLSEKPGCGCCAGEELMERCWEENIIYKEVTNERTTPQN